MLPLGVIGAWQIFVIVFFFSFFLALIAYLIHYVKKK